MVANCPPYELTFGPILSSREGVVSPGDLDCPSCQTAWACGTRSLGPWRPCTSMRKVGAAEGLCRFAALNGL